MTEARLVEVLIEASAAAEEYGAQARPHPRLSDELLAALRRLRLAIERLFS